MHDSAYDNVGRVQTDNYSCTATMIAPDVLITAKHCAEGDTMRAIFREYGDAGDGSEQLVGGVDNLRKHPDTDLMMARVGFGTCNPRGGCQRLPTGADINFQTPTIGTDVTAVGYGRRDDEDIVQREAGGKVALFSGDAIGVSVLVTCTGDSGGPLLDQDLKVIGVLSGSTRDVNDRCGSTSLFTKTGQYQTWIEDTLRELQQG